MATDPTKTKTLRSNFESEVFTRFRSLKGTYRTAIQAKDVLHLGAQRTLNEAPDPSSYKFLTNEEKQSRFESWLQRQVDNGILVVENRDTVRRGEHYTGPYIRRAYASGVRQAGQNLRQEGYDVEQQTLDEIFNQPVHASKVEELYLRAFDNLESITTDMGDEISQELAEALTEGKNPRKAARSINDRVDKVGITRARMLARTEVIHSHAEGTLDRFESEGFEEVRPDVEFHSAGDACPICSNLSGSTYTIEQARGKIPQHVNCRCTWLPVTDN